MAAVQHALVVGGGIGGLTAAVAMRQAGIDVDLIEANPTFSVYGVGIIQPNNTLRALNRVGLATQCVKAGTPFAGWRIFDGKNNFLMAAPNSSSAAPAFPPNNGIPRPALQKILSAAAYEHNVKIKLGTKLASLDNSADGVTVVLSDGSDARYDLVVGCDGIYSDTRQRVFGSLPAPEFTGQAVWRYNLPRFAGLDWGEIHSGPHNKVGLVPIRPDLMYMFLVTAEPGNPRRPPEGLADSMRERLSGYEGVVAELREQITDPAGIVYKPMEHLLLPAPWVTNRVLIIGDAAHATTPHLAQGAAMAIEDAVLLGELLRREDSFSDLMTEFMRRRFDRAKFVIDCSDQIAGWELESWKGIQNPDARPGEVLHTASAALLEDY